MDKWSDQKYGNWDLNYVGGYPEDDQAGTKSTKNTGTINDIIAKLYNYKVLSITAEVNIHRARQ